MNNTIIPKILVKYFNKLASLTANILTILAFVSALAFGTQALATSEWNVKKVQSKLYELGYDPGKLDGIWGKRTQSALTNFLKDKNLEFDGSLDKDDFVALGLANTSELKTKIKIVKNPQYEKYKNIIKTPITDFKVNNDFTLVKNVRKFKKHVSEVVPIQLGTVPGPRGFYNNYNGDKCVDDLSTMTTVSAIKNYQKGSLVWSNAVCRNIIAWDFSKNVRNNAFKHIILYWLENNILKNANKLKSKHADHRADMTYVIRATVSNVMGHYAVYHNLYNLSDEQHNAVDRMFTEFVTGYDYYSNISKRGPYFAKLCDVKNPKSWAKKLKGTNDHCGTAVANIAVGATYYGVEFGNQAVFDYGAQAIEIFLGMLTSDKVWASQIGRGTLGLSYADELPPLVDQLDLLFEMAFDFDFDEYRNVHGVTPGEVYEHFWTVANNPKLMVPYHNVNNDHGAKYKGEFLHLIENELPQSVWGAFSIRRYITTAPMLSKKYQPELSSKIKPDPDSYNFGMRVTGFSPRVLRQAIGMHE